MANSLSRGDDISTLRRSLKGARGQQYDAGGGAISTHHGETRSTHVFPFRGHIHTSPLWFEMDLLDLAEAR